MQILAKSESVLGSVVEIKLASSNSDLFNACFFELRRIEAAYSRFKDDSELSAINRNIGKWWDVSPELLHLISKAEHFNSTTGGNFDITLKSALDRLGYDMDYSFIEKKALPTFAKLRPQIDAENLRVLLHDEIEFGGFGKGYALDCVAKILESRGVLHYYINAGGDIYAKRDPLLDPWIILLEHPDDPQKAIGTIELDGNSIAGSAPNRRKWGDGLHHLLNAKTGLPASGVKAIFVLAKTGIDADAYATAIFTAGFEDGIVLSKKLPLQALIISSNNKMYQSSGFDAELFD